MDKDFSPAISVIVPVYNVEKYLRKCVDSILAQTFKDFELILVDDGSPDNSGKICDEYAKIDSRVVVIHQKNGGQSNARNTGLDAAKGKYIYFCDSDDYIAPDLLEKTYNKAEIGGFDQVKFNTINIHGEKINGGSAFLSGDFCLSSDEKKKIFITENFLSYKIGWETCTALFKKSIIDAHHIRFYNGINLAEDLCFNLIHLFYCDKVAVLPDKLYYYLLRDDSTTGQAKAKNRLHEKIKLFAAMKDATPEPLNDILPYVFYTLTANWLWNKRIKVNKAEFIKYCEILDNLEEKDLFCKWSKISYFSLKKYNAQKYGKSLGGKINASNKLLFNRKYCAYSIKWRFYSLISFPERVINKIKKICKGKK